MSLPFLQIGFYYHYYQLNQPGLKQEVCLIYRTASELINVFDQKIKILWTWQNKLHSPRYSFTLLCDATVTAIEASVSCTVCTNRMPHLLYCSVALYIIIIICFHYIKNPLNTVQTHIPVLINVTHRFKLTTTLLIMALHTNICTNKIYFPGFFWQRLTIILVTEGKPAVIRGNCFNILNFNHNWGGKVGSHNTLNAKMYISLCFNLRHRQI